jgi:iron-sulfur cluster repair protein YtfE (RIC family)
LAGLSANLRDDLLEHFANEQEGLFPFVRKYVPAEMGAVDRLEAAHDAICGAIVRLAHLAARDQVVTREALVVYQRFESSYAAHSRDEAELFERLGRLLTPEHQRELAEHLQGLA